MKAKLRVCASCEWIFTDGVEYLSANSDLTALITSMVRGATLTRKPNNLGMTKKWLSTQLNCKVRYLGVRITMV